MQTSPYLDIVIAGIRHELGLTVPFRYLHRVTEHAMQLSFQGTGVMLVREIPIDGLPSWSVFEIVQSSAFRQPAVGALQGKVFRLSKPQEFEEFCACVRDPQTLVLVWCRYVRHSLPAPFAQHPLIPLAVLDELWPAAPTEIEGVCEFSIECPQEHVTRFRFCSWTSLSWEECAVDRWTVTRGPWEKLQFQVERLLLAQR